ncbi:MAG: hypothetical protein U0232_03355 [Thermomicrobiales bacterium]
MAALIVRSMSWDGESWTNDFTDRNGLQAELWQAIGALQHYSVASVPATAPSARTTW